MFSNFSPDEILSHFATEALKAMTVLALIIAQCNNQIILMRN